MEAVFASTRWSVVLGARAGETARREALETLCRSYWMPVYGYLRRRGQSPHDAEDLTQGFFASLFEGDFFQRPDPEKGRFRGYLVGALKHFVGHHYERLNAEKRGGGVQFIDWSAAEAERLYTEYDLPKFDPAEAYETTWALTLLARALKRLEEEQRAAGREKAFAVLKPYLGSSPGRGEYDVAAQKLGATRTNIALQVHRLSHRYGELVRLEVAETVADPTEVPDEMKLLLKALRR